MSGANKAWRNGDEALVRVRIVDAEPDHDGELLLMVMSRSRSDCYALPSDLVEAPEPEGKP